MNSTEVLTRPLLPEDRALLKKLENKAWFALLRLYVPLFLMLVYLYWRVNIGSIFRGHSLNRRYSAAVFPYFSAFFGFLFLGFMIRDFRRMILPFLREAKMGQKTCCSFAAKKYHDPLYDKRLLFYPNKDNYYIEISPEDFDATGNGEELYLEIARMTGEVLLLRSADREFKAPAEFSFSD